MADLRQQRYAAVHRARGELPVMTGAGDEIAAGVGGRGHMRASHADREQVIETLKAAFVQGRLDRDEFDLRVARRSRRGPMRSWPPSPPASLPGWPRQSRPYPPRYRASSHFSGPAG
jgi:Domain of unknown function (DUF1707)